MRACILSLIIVTLGAASTEQMQVVEPFDAERYMGTWYEIARLPNRFEDGLESITATYSLRDDGTVSVVNTGWNLAWKRWKTSEASAVFADDQRERGWLKVTFFWPFSAHYKVLRLDPDYRWALVTSGSTDLLWILAREPRLDAAVRAQLLADAAALGFDTDALIWVDHSHHGRESEPDPHRERRGRSR